MARLTVFALLLATVTHALADDETYWRLACENGTLEADRKKQSYRCKVPDGKTREYRAGTCKRHTKLSQENNQRSNFMCRGTTISSAGDAGTWGSFENYKCRTGWFKNRLAGRAQETCMREIDGFRYETPVLVPQQ